MGQRIRVQWRLDRCGTPPRFHEFPLSLGTGAERLQCFYPEHLGLLPATLLAISIEVVDPALELIEYVSPLEVLADG